MYIFNVVSAQLQHKYRFAFFVLAFFNSIETTSSQNSRAAICMLATRISACTARESLPARHESLCMPGTRLPSRTIIVVMLSLPCLTFSRQCRLCFHSQTMQILLPLAEDVIVIVSQEVLDLSVRPESVCQPHKNHEMEHSSSLY